MMSHTSIYVGIALFAMKLKAITTVKFAQLILPVNATKLGVGMIKMIQ